MEKSSDKWILFAFPDSMVSMYIRKNSWDNVWNRPLRFIFESFANRQGFLTRDAGCHYCVIKKFIAFYGTRNFITVFTRARHLSLSWAIRIQSITFHPISFRSILILYFQLCYVFQLVSFLQFSRQNFVTCCFLYGELFLVLHQTSKPEDHPLSVVRDCLFNIPRNRRYPPCLEAIFSISILMTCHAVYTRGHLTWVIHIHNAEKQSTKSDELWS